VDNVNVVYTLQDMPPAALPSLFLAGPTPRQAYVKSWRPEALRMIRRCQKAMIVFYPEPPGLDKWDPDGVKHVRWERNALTRSSVILFWMDRKLTTMPGFRSNTEWGFWTARDPSRLILAHPVKAPGMRGMIDDAQCHNIPVVHSLSAGINLALEKLFPSG
jgi:hypothetical protein